MVPNGAEDPRNIVPADQSTVKSAIDPTKPTTDCSTDYSAYETTVFAAE
jgi:hypothetical protein